MSIHQSHHLMAPCQVIPCWTHWGLYHMKFLTLSMRVSSLSRCSSLWLNAGARVHLRVRMHDWRRPPSEFRTGADEPRYAKRVRQIEQRVDGRGHLDMYFRRSGGASCGVVVVGPVAPRTCFIT